MTEYGTCEICKDRPAKMIMLRRHNEDVNRTFVCLECAGERAKLYSSSSLDLEKIHYRIDLTKKRSDNRSTYSCRLCGVTLADIVVDSEPGCCLCYSRFESEIEQAIRASQGKISHIGKAPVR